MTVIRDALKSDCYKAGTARTPALSVSTYRVALPKGTIAYETHRQISIATWEELASWDAEKNGVDAAAEALAYHGFIVAWMAAGLPGYPAPAPYTSFAVDVPPSAYGPAMRLLTIGARLVLCGYKPGVAATVEGARAVWASLLREASS